MICLNGKKEKGKIQGEKNQVGQDLKTVSHFHAVLPLRF